MTGNRTYRLAHRPHRTLANAVDQHNTTSMNPTKVPGTTYRHPDSAPAPARTRR
jgi:hypothetical protein